MKVCCIQIWLRSYRFKIALWSIICIILLWAPQPWAQTGITPDSGGLKGPLSLKNLAGRINEAEKQQGDPNQTELSLLREAQLFVQKQKDSERKTREYKKTAESAPREVKRIERRLAEPMKQEAASPPARADIDTLTQQLEKMRGRLEAQRRLRDEIKSETIKQATRRQKIPDEIAEIKKRREQVNKELNNPPQGNQTEQLTSARQLMLKAEDAYLHQKLAEIEAELSYYDASRELVRARKQWAEREILQAERQVQAWEDRVSLLRSAQAQQTQRSAEQAQIATATAHPAVRSVVDENAALAKEMTQVAERTAKANHTAQEIEESLLRVSDNFSTAKEKMNRLGLTDAVGLRLKSQLLQLPDTDKHKLALTKRRRELTQVQLRRIELEDTLLSMVDLAQEAQKRLNGFDAQMTNEKRQELLASMQKVLKIQKEQYLNELIKAYDFYFDDTLLPLQENQRQLVHTTEDYTNFIAERILWMQSTNPLGWQDIMRTGSSLSWLLTLSNWQNALRTVFYSIVDHPLPSFLFVLSLTMLLALRNRIRQRLNHYLSRPRNSYSLTIAHTLRALLLLALLCAPGPLILFFLYHLLSNPSEYNFTTALASGLYYTAYLLFTGLFLQQLIGEKGLGETHFGWRPAGLHLISQQLQWLIPVAVVLVFLITTTNAQPIEAYRESLGRLAFITAMLASVFFLRPVFNPSHALMKPFLSVHAGGWLDRLQYLWYPSLMLIPVALAIAAAVGYYYTSLQLEKRLLFSIEFLIVLFMLYAVLLRWLHQQQNKFREDAEPATASTPPKAKEPGAETDYGGTGGLDESELTTISTQTRNFLNSLLLIATLVGLYLIWEDVFPALSILREIELWSVSSSVTDQTNNGGSGTIETMVPITLSDVGQALVILIITATFSKNLPGLLEMAVLHHLPITPSGSYAITSVVRYSIVIIGIAWAFGAIGISWSKVQFLAAAVIVGLGFGLQEIFANFVSGLIILFERQIRVGDAVTIGNTSGIISRIRMRATTVTDWNLKELIIPNKEFVTGQVINWSLSDPRLRVDIPVAIARNADTAKAMALMLEAAREHDQVLSDPKPVALFLDFGESTLNFELRVYIPHFDNNLSITHDLLNAMTEKFRREGIELAYPQRDIHIRSYEQGAKPDRMF